MAQKLVNLNPASYEHEFDKKALNVVKNIPLLPSAAEWILNWTVIRQNMIALCGSNFHITKSACPELYRLCTEVYDTLCLPTYPEVYAQQDYYINAYTTGYQTKSFIVISSGAADKLNDDELKFVIGHEAGHVKSGHVLYHLASAYLGSAINLIPGAGVLASALTLSALRYWNRMSEFTADRAGLLACQNLDAAVSSIMKMSGLPERFYKTADLKGFVQQAKEFEHKYGGTTDNVYKLMNIIDEDHPWTVIRAAELIKWVESGEYDKILSSSEGKQCPICKGFYPNECMVCPKDGYHW